MDLAMVTEVHIEMHVTIIVYVFTYIISLFGTL